MYRQYLRYWKLQNCLVFFSRFIIEKLNLQDRWLIKKKRMFQVELSFTKSVKKENCAPVWEKCVPGLYLCFCLNFMSFCGISLTAFRHFILHNLVIYELFGLEFCVVQQGTFYYEQIKRYKNLPIYIIGWSDLDGIVTTFLQKAQKWKLSNKIWQKLVFSSTLAATLRYYAKINW